MPKYTEVGHNHYLGLDTIRILIDQYDSYDTRTWPYYVIVMPLSEDGQGPETEKDCYSISWEVWDRYCNSISSHKYLSDAINKAMKLNGELIGTQY